MKILSAAQIKNWDQYTIEHEPISSVLLMERAALACTNWILSHFSGREFIILCCKGNNGGDGLAIARLLHQKKSDLTVFILNTDQKASTDFQWNLSMLENESPFEIHFINDADKLFVENREIIVVDALFGTGLNRPLDGLAALLVNKVNKLQNTVISIDIPSGLYADKSSKNNVVVNATYTLSFQTYKMASLMAENAGAIGKLHLLDINLSTAFYNDLETESELIDDEIIGRIYKPRAEFGHKATFGHALIVAGSYGKTGAAQLCAKACVHSGVGLVSAHVPSSAYAILQTSVPEMMLYTDAHERILTEVNTDPSLYQSIAVGPGIGQSNETVSMLEQLLSKTKKPMVLDADALNILGQNQELIKFIPKASIITPHPKEFERLFGATVNEFERIALAKQKAQELQFVIVLKGHHSLIALPSGKSYFNSTGNSGMATGGSGDILTGLLLGLLAQGYKSDEAAILGVYLHGLAGDRAAIKSAEESLSASEIIAEFGTAFKEIRSYKALD